MGEATRHSQPFLVVPRHGTRARMQKRCFTCTGVEGAEELPPYPPSPGVRVVRLDMQVLQERQRPSRRPTEMKRPRNQASHKTILLWVDMQTKEIMKSSHAPSSLFQVGSSLVVLEKPRQEGAVQCNIFQRIDASMFETEVFEEWEPAGLGTYTMVSGGYELCAETQLVKWGEVWDGRDQQWWHLALCHVRLMGTSEQALSEESIQTRGKCNL